MFQYGGKSVFSRVSEWHKAFFLASALAAAFIFQEPPHLFLLLAFLLAFLFAAGYRGFRGLFLGLVPFLLLADAGFLIFLSDSGLDLLRLTLSSNLRILCLFTATAFFTFSTDVFALLRLLKGLRFPEFFYLPVFVLFRFLPEIEQDLVEIAGIQKLKGISKRKPFLFIKSVLVPLLFTALQKGDDLAIAYFLRKRRESF